MSRPDCLPENAEIVAERETMMLIQSPEDDPGKEYVLDTGETMIEFSLDEILILDKMLDFWHLENAEKIAKQESSDSSGSETKEEL